ncbi:2-hydroxyacylsphingosine 1-beta-galactosyltransferase isoform X2 [Harpegnathos saltator]|uniref:2-hydroxyacylsphingosine 1-beta-galactosyltransferase isoform X2 n=1 Tax=Harpegnathos saltator TaxID=610380 RepID=UPI00058EA4D3|nr:2-hydroxyacylsphingosine 1-beta-galactosyltransferase isoform X2 [Harpegnathos saltator]
MQMIIHAICIVLYLWLLPTNNIADGKRILAISISPWYSHQAVFRTLFTALNKRGHELVVVTSRPMRDPTLKNYTEIQVSAVIEVLPEFNEFIQSKSLSLFEKNMYLMRFLNNIDQRAFKEPGMIKLYRHDNNEKFDTVIIEALTGPAFYAMAQRFNVPVIEVSSVGMYNCQRYFRGYPIAASHPSNWENYVKEASSMWQKLQNFFHTWMFIYTWANKFMIMEQEITNKYFGNDAPNVMDAMKNISLTMINDNPILRYARPEQPNVISFSGFHINKIPPTLPGDLRRFLDNATEGFIYVSLGTTASWSNLSKELLGKFVEVFSKLPYKIVWKYDSDEWSSRKLDNVFISKWFPQQGVLAHPNIKLFIYQGGLQSTEEAVHYAVPLLGFPIIYDQHSRLQRLASLVTKRT